MKRSNPKLLLIFFWIILSFLSCNLEEIPEVTNNNLSPNACFSTNKTECNVSDCTVNFDASCSSNSVNYKWDFNNDGIIDEQGTNKIQTNHTYTTSGIKTIKLIVENSSGSSNETTKTVNVIDSSNPTPVASFDINNSGCIATCEVTFTNTSMNADSFEWNFGDGSSTSTDLSPSHTYQNAGNYEVQLIATGAGGSNTTLQTVIINAPAPIANFNFSPNNCYVPCQVNFTNTSTNANSYEWNFGDGSSINTQTNPTHTFQNDGDFTVQLNANGDGGNDDISKTITINPVYLFDNLHLEGTGTVGNAIIALSDGNYLLVGSKNNSNDAPDAFLLKLSPDGNTDWSSPYGGGGIVADGFYDGIETQNGDYYIVGTTEASNGIDAFIYLTQLDSDGNVKSGFPKSYPYNLASGINGWLGNMTVVKDNSGNIYLQDGKGSIWKFNSSGLLASGFPKAISGASYISDIAITDNNQLLLLGGNSSDKIYLGIYDTNGNQSSIKTHDFPSSDMRATSIEVLPDNQIIIGGGSYLVSSNTLAKAFFLKLSENGNSVLLNKEYDFPSAVSYGSLNWTTIDITAISEIQNENIVFVGSSSQQGGVGSVEAAIFMVNNNGNMINGFPQSFSDGYGEGRPIRDVKATLDGGFIVTGNDNEFLYVRKSDEDGN